MLLFIVILCALTISQIKATTVGPASWNVTKIILYLVDVNSDDISLKKRTEMWVDIVEKGTGYYTQCLLRTSFPPSDDEWSFCSGGQFYIRARGLSRYTDIEYNLDVARMRTEGSVSRYIQFYNCTHWTGSIRLLGQI
jgi:hypothetical protein